MKSSSAKARTGRLAKIYPQIENGRVLADVEVADLDDRFIGRRVPVRLPGWVNVSHSGAAIRAHHTGEALILSQHR